MAGSPTSLAMVGRRTSMGERGLVAKYQVQQVLGWDDDTTMFTLGLPLTDVFVLRPEKDATALAALMHYANLTPNEALADDLHDWIRRINDG